MIHYIFKKEISFPQDSKLEQAIFGMGCFWGAEKKFWELDGVKLTAVGYAGGISKDNSSKKIKIIRKNKEEIKIYKVDLSTIDGINQGNMVMQSHDIIYITPNINLIPEIMDDLSPVLSFISTITLAWFTITQLAK